MSVANPVFAVILAGGSGSRLWPLSRLQLPKQFLKLNGDMTLLEATVARLRPIISKANVLIVTGEANAKGEAFIPLEPYEKLLEPDPRNTAPAIALAATYFLARGQDPVLVILPADHVIRDVAAFHSCLRTAIATAETGKLVTFGIEPTAPETGFGYIKAPPAAAGIPHVERFKEKPDAATAESFLREGGWYWNSGMFVWRASTIMQEIRRALPELADVMSELSLAVKNGLPWENAIKTHFGKAQSISIDHGVLESSQNLYLVPAAIGWSDVGSWDAVYEIAEKDQAGNASQGNVLTIDCKNTLIRGEKRLIAVVGMENVSVIETADAILISQRGTSQKVREVVDELVKRAAPEHVTHLTVHRPWGTYIVLEEAPGFKIKRIEVRPGGRLSLQSHSHRSEHWVVVSGEAKVTCDNKVATLIKNQSTYIPIGAKHRLENLGTEPLQIIEAQVGDYVGEDDIQRYDDQYGRADK